jgi:UDP-2,4-diacetamido-2,4,6-trideoxy-beta-L-altropyranose hydrolase
LIKKYQPDKVYILTEGGFDIGFGHITRCTSLYQSFYERGIIPEFIVNGDRAVEVLLKDKKYRILNWLNEQEELFGLIKNADIAVIDSYLADYELYEKVSKVVSVPVYIDDTQRIDYSKGIVINGSIYAEELDYTRRKDVIYLLGSQYIPLRREFWDIPGKEIKESIKSAMITFGGDDTKSMTPTVLKLLTEHHPELTKDVVIGKGFQNIKEIESAADKRTNLIYFPDAEGMKKIMLESDIAISAGGQTLYELARVGVPTIAIAVADNQMNNVKGWHRAGFIRYAGWWEDEVVLENIKNSLKLLEDKSLRERMTKIGRTLVDGKGARRVVQKVFDIHEGLI